MDRKENNTMRIKVLLLSLCIFPLSYCYAEHVFDAGIHGGMTGWEAQTTYVSAQAGGQYGAHLHYSFITPYVVGFRVGLTVDSHNASLSKKNYEDSYSTIDVEDQQMDIRYTISDLHERYTTWSLGIPMQLSLTRKRFTFLAGAKAVLPFPGTWKQTVSHAALSVYYPDFDNLVEESVPLAASQDFDMMQTGKWKQPTVQWWLALELNYAIPLQIWSPKIKTYIVVGAYFDYCFTAYQPKLLGTESLITLTDTRAGFPLQRVLTPVMEATWHGRQMVHEIKPYDLGIKVSFAISPYDQHAASKQCHCL